MSELYFGSSFLPRNSTISDQTNCRQTFYNGATEAKVGWRYDANGAIHVHAGANSSAALLASSANGVITPKGTTATGADSIFIELYVLFHASAGVVKVWVDDAEVINATGLNTSPSGTAQADRWRQYITGTSQIWDDFYCNDTGGAAPHNGRYSTAFRVYGRVPNADGSRTGEWTKGGAIGANEFNQVDDNGNDDTDYLASSTLGHRATFAMGGGATLLVSHKTYLTRAEAALYLQVSERSIAEWAARAAADNPLPERRAGGEPRYRREDVDAWTEREGQRRRLKLAG